LISNKTIGQTFSNIFNWTKTRGLKDLIIFFQRLDIGELLKSHKIALSKKKSLLYIKYFFVILFTNHYNKINTNHVINMYNILTIRV